MKPLKSLIISGREVLPLVEGGKGIAISNGESSGAWAATGGVGTFSGVNADSFDENAVEWDQLGELTNDFLKDLGVTATGHRMRIL